MLVAHTLRTGLGVACSLLALTICATMTAADPVKDLRQRMEHACLYGGVGDVRLLLRQGASASGTSADGYSFINLAAENDHNGARIIP